MMKKRVVTALMAGVVACGLTGCVGTPVIYNNCDCAEQVAELLSAMENIIYKKPAEHQFHLTAKEGAEEMKNMSQIGG